MQVEDEVGQADLLEALEDGVDRRALLGDEQHRLAARDEAGDEVADRLALAGAGRPLDDEVLAAQHLVDREVLARVGIQDQEFVGRRCLIGQCRVDVDPAIADGLACIGVAGQRGDQVMLGERFDGPLEIADHRQLRVGEVAQHHLRPDGEPGHAARPLSQPRVRDLKLLGRVDRAFHAGARQQLVGIALDVELGRERVEERRVDLELAGDLKVEVLLGGATCGQASRAPTGSGAAGSAVPCWLSHVARPHAR